jgi:PadR family transcriptional regulator, regulatory protein PadR
LKVYRRAATVVDSQQERAALSELKAGVPYGTLDLMILKTLDTMGSLHGYGIARRIEQVAEGSLALNQGTIYPALLRLEQRRWIRSDWGSSENNRRARYYSVTKLGKRQLLVEEANWHRTVAMLARLLEGAQ